MSLRQPGGAKSAQGNGSTRQARIQQELVNKSLKIGVAIYLSTVARH